MGNDRFDLRGRRAVIATMHGKERVIAPVLERMGLTPIVASDLDTDRFGTFTREVARSGSQEDAARAKARAALELHPDIDVAVASEGSFGPHPFLPFVAGNAELVLLLDRATGLELSGRHVTEDTNYASACVESQAEATAFAEQAGLPGHGMMVIAAPNGLPRPDLYLRKGLTEASDLAAALEAAFAFCAAAWIETDMRAHLNPTRMRAIKAAADDLDRRWNSRCPDCSRPGWDVVAHVPGRLCAWCGRETDLPKAERLACAGCGHSERRSLLAPPVDPGQCPACNP